MLQVEVCFPSLPHVSDIAYSPSLLRVITLKLRVDVMTPCSVQPAECMWSVISQQAAAQCSGCVCSDGQNDFATGAKWEPGVGESAVGGRKVTLIRRRERRRVQRGADGGAK